jgi:transketolase
MRDELTSALLPLADEPDMVFLTGDLGYGLFDPLAEALGDRFINAGVAEQNMVSVAAGLAKSGFKPWLYSIAPFLFARPFEQVRNDICLHNLPVKLLGNGGGLGYGVLGPTHHAVEDYGVLLTLPNMRVFAPAFDQDVPGVVARVHGLAGPSYVRLGRGELPSGETAPSYLPWRRVVEGTGPIVFTTGTIAGAVWSALRTLEGVSRPDVWIVAELPLTDGLPAEAIHRIAEGAPIVVVEEHVKHGGLGSMLAHWLLTHGVPVTKMVSLGLESVSLGAYGRQQYLREVSGLGADSIRAAVTQVGGV